MHADTNEVLEALDDLRPGDKRLSDTIVRCLSKLLPSSDDEKMLKEYDGDMQRLNNAERFLCRLVKVETRTGDGSSLNSS